jgi:hypothetical protein
MMFGIARSPAVAAVAFNTCLREIFFRDPVDTVIFISLCWTFRSQRRAWDAVPYEGDRWSDPCRSVHLAVEKALGEMPGILRFARKAP